MFVNSSAFTSLEGHVEDAVRLQGICDPADGIVQ
jgi:hypothetical protein